MYKSSILVLRHNAITINQLKLNTNTLFPLFCHSQFLTTNSWPVIHRFIVLHISLLLIRDHRQIRWCRWIPAETRLLPLLSGLEDHEIYLPTFPTAMAHQLVI
jgi:hypothetical protein